MKWSPERLENTRRKRFVRRTYSRAPLIALLLIRERYPAYQESDLWADLQVKHRRKRTFRRPKGRKQHYFRNEQICKYAAQLKSLEQWQDEYDKACQQIAMLTEAEKERRDIRLVVKKGKEVKHYFFKHWTREHFVIKFIESANNKALGFNELDTLHSNLVDQSLGRTPK